ncbi:CHAT domain-containing protein [Erythrobacter donghaensis]|uniref:CHAT domain-containing protein n=1 Tax=Erythrobacter donghaensis TaxID=267135 RepID=UPI00130247E1|nr:CHAT domain-containing protein [Erythrobacter donghaensis]
MRHIFWSSINALAALALLAGSATLEAQEFAADIPIIDSVARYEAASARLADTSEPLTPQERIRTASEAITAAYFSERHAEASALYAQFRDAELDPVTRVAGLGSTLQSGADAALKEQARSELKTIGASATRSAPLAPALSQSALGADAMLRDDLPGAVAFFAAAMELARRDLPADDPFQVRFAVQHATHLQYADRLAGREAAERSERLALEILPEGHPYWIDVWYNMADRAQSAGRFDEAATLFARITDLAVREWGEDDTRLYPILQYRAVALSGLARRSEALEIARAAIAVERDKSAGDRAMHRELIGGLLLGEGDIAGAAASYREGLALLKGTDPSDLRWGFIESRLARAESFLGNNAEALKMAELAAPAFAAKLPPTHPARITGELMIAKTQARAGAPDRGFALLEASVAANEAKLLDTYARAQDLRTIAAGNNTLFRDFAWVALKNGRMEEAWRAAQLATLSEMALSSAQISYPKDAAGFGAALDTVRAARGEEAAIRDQLAAGTVTAEDLSNAITRREAAERDLEARYPDHAEFLRPKPTTLAEAQAGLEADEAIVIPMVIEDRNAAIIVTRDNAAWSETVSAYNSTPALIAKLRDSLQESSIADGAFDAEAAHEIYRRFFPPEAAKALAGKTRLIFPSGGPLAQIPPAVLMSAPAAGDTPGRYLIEDFAIAVRSSLRPITRAAASAPGRGFAGIGAPALARTNGAATSLRGLAIDPADLRALPSLPGSLAELTAMQAAFAGEPSLLLTGAQATEPQVRAAPLGDYRVLAFSTHGLVGGQIAQLSEPALVLTPPDAAASGNDGLLTASEIAALDLNADWVILSACNTAAGNGRGSATYGGLARAFQLAGARSLLLSHWPVRDDAAAFLSVETLRRTEAGADRAEALRAAQLAMVRGQSGIAGESDPAVWAPFVLIEG